MAEGGDKKTVSMVVSMAQDNIFLRKVVRLMADFILESGIFNYSVSANTRQQYYAVMKYFKTEALNQLIENGIEMGINTPWGKDVTRLYKHRELSDYDDEDNNGLIDFDEFGEDDIEDEQED